MVSTISSVFPSELGLTDPFSAFETGFTPWVDESDLFSMFDSSINPFDTIPGSDKPHSDRTQNQTDSNSGLEDRCQNQTGSESDLVAAVFDARREKRKISNRESARRSRMRKQKHLENLRIQLNRLRIENRELANRLRYVLYHCQRACTENNRLRREHRVLREKLLHTRQALVLRQIHQQSSSHDTWPCSNNIVLTADHQIQNPSLITSQIIQ